MPLCLQEVVIWVQILHVLINCYVIDMELTQISCMLSLRRNWWIDITIHELNI
jgi:hypothetical protein